MGAGLGMLLVLEFYLFFLKEYATRDDVPYINQEAVPLFGETKYVSQGFRSPGSLARIDILMANYKKKPTRGTLQLAIFKGNRCLYTKNVGADTVEDNLFYSFLIEKRIIGAGNYEMRLRFDRLSEDDRLAVWVSAKNLYKYGALSINGKRRKGDLTFRVYYRSTIWEARERWLKDVPGFPPRNTLFALFFLLFLIVLNGGFYYFLRKL